MTRRPPRSPPFPYTTLFRSTWRGRAALIAGGGGGGGSRLVQGLVHPPRHGRGHVAGARADEDHGHHLGLVSRRVGSEPADPGDRKSTRLTPVTVKYRMPSSA